VRRATDRTKKKTSGDLV